MKYFLSITFIAYCFSVQSQTKDIAKEALAAHNKYRLEVGVKPLVWSAELAASAQQYANYLTRNRIFKHSTIKGVGENLWRGYTEDYTVTDMINMWGSEKLNFINEPCPNYAINPRQKVGHYTQMIWRNTTQLGCAIANNAEEEEYLVCHYKETGNVVGQKAY